MLLSEILKTTWSLVTTFGILDVEYFMRHEENYIEGNPSKFMAINLEDTKENSLNVGRRRRIVINIMESQALGDVWW